MGLGSSVVSGTVGFKPTCKKEQSGFGRDTLSILIRSPAGFATALLSATVLYCNVLYRTVAPYYYGTYLPRYKAREGRGSH